MQTAWFIKPVEKRYEQVAVHVTIKYRIILLMSPNRMRKTKA